MQGLLSHQREQSLFFASKQLKAFMLPIFYTFREHFGSAIIDAKQP